MSVLTFAIESSCDETSAAVLKDSEVLSNIISSQFFHKKYGGIVPELASRAHIEIISEIADKAIKESSIDINEIGLVSAAKGPGLIGSLLVGYNFAKGLALALKKTFMGIDHIESHLFSCFIGKDDISFPFIALVVSGGHTILFHVTGFNSYNILGNTADDAAGEAFDKAAKMLGLEYPGGPLIDKYANTGNSSFHKFPKSSIKGRPYDFSFSGIKTSLLYYIRDNYGSDISKLPLNDICASFQKSVTDVLVEKTIKAAKEHGCSIIAVSGGVSANSELRHKFSGQEKAGFKVFFPEKIYSTDNAAMIGFNAFIKYKSAGYKITADTITESAYARFKYSSSK